MVSSPPCPQLSTSALSQRALCTSLKAAVQTAGQGRQLPRALGSHTVKSGRAASQGRGRLGV